MTAKVLQLRDFKRREENDAQLRGFADQILAEALDCAPCEMPPVQPDFTVPSSDPA